MSNLTGTPGWDDVPQIETTTLVLGGSGGPSNAQAQALVNRTEVINPDNQTIPTSVDGTEGWAIKSVSGSWFKLTGNKIVEFLSSKFTPHPSTLSNGTLAGTETASVLQSGNWVKTTLSAIANYVISVFTIAIQTGGSLRTLLAWMRDRPVSVKDFGATGNGSTDDTSALTTAAALTGDVYIPAGTYIISANIAFTSRAIFASGAVFAIATGVTVAFNGGITAPVSQIFACTGTGSVSINAAKRVSGYPEWWGAQPGNSGFDCSTYINACIAACAITELMPVTYYVAAPVKILAGGKELRGAANIQMGTSGGSTIAATSGSINILQVGPDSYSGSQQNSNSVRNISVTRTVAPVISANTSSVLVQFTAWTTLKNVSSYDSSICFQLRGVTQLHAKNCLALRALAGSGTGTDKLYGFHINGDTNIGLAGGNASVYLTDCAVGSSVTWTSALNYQGFVLDGAYGYSDVFMFSPETWNLGIGINLQGNGNSSTTYDIQNEDVRIYNPVLDANGLYGIGFFSTSLYGSAQVIGGYINANSNNTTGACVIYSSSLGQVYMTGVQFLMAPNGNAGTCAVRAVSSQHIKHVGNVAMDCKGSNGVYDLQSVSLSAFEDQIFNESITNGNSAVRVSNSSRNSFKMSVSGKANAFQYGYQIVDASSGYNEFNGTGINPGCLSVSTGKLWNNGTAVTTQTTFGNNNVSIGVMS